MKSFFNLFAKSYSEMFGENRSANLRCMVTTALLIAVSMALEALTIQLPFAKVNFAFIAVAAIGMLYGPFVAFFATGICDVVGYIAHPDGMFIPAYILIAMLQGLIYGLVLYRGWGDMNIRERTAEFTARVVAARLLDVLIINLFLNTAANLHYGFIAADSLGAALSVRVTKNLLELIADIPLLLALLPAINAAYNSVRGRNR